VAKNIQCSVNITEVDGKLMILAKIPDGAEESIPGLLAKAMIQRSREIMNEVLGENQRVEKIGSA
jgi:hypothetical protein